MTRKGGRFYSLFLTILLTHRGRKRERGANYEQGYATHDAKGIGHLSYAFVGNYNCGGGFEEECAIGNHSADSGKHDSKDNTENSHE